MPLCAPPEPCRLDQAEAIIAIQKSGSPLGRDGAGVRAPRHIVRTAVVALTPGSGLTTAASAALEVSRASVHRYRAARIAPPRATKPRPPVARALRTSERDQVLAHLRPPRLKDQTPTEVYATLPGEGVYLCRVRTMYLDPCRSGRGRRTPPPASPPGLSKARTAGRRAK